MPAHVMSFEVTVQPYDRTAIGMGLDARLLGIGQQIEAHRPLEIVVAVLSRQALVVVVAVPACGRLAELGVLESQLRHVAAVAAGLAEGDPALLDLGHGRVVRRANQAELGEAQQ